MLHITFGYLLNLAVFLSDNNENKSVKVAIFIKIIFKKNNMEKSITELEQLTLNSSSRKFLRETAKWTKFLAILGFVAMGFMVLMSFFIGSIFKTLPQASELPADFGFVMAIVYLIIAGLYFFPIYYLFQFSKQLKAALLSKSDETLAVAFEMLKSHYKFAGVFSIIILSLYVLTIIASIFTSFMF